VCSPRPAVAQRPSDPLSRGTTARALVARGIWAHGVAQDFRACPNPSPAIAEPQVGAGAVPELIGPERYTRASTICD